MRTFKIKDKEFNVATEWSELTLRQYMSLVKVQDKYTKGEYEIETLYMVAIFELLCNAETGELNEMDLDTLNILTESMKFVSNTPKLNHLEHLNINGIDYVFNHDFNTLKLSEVIAIQLLQKQFTDPIELVPQMLGVLLRPGHKVYDNETKKDVWVQDKYDSTNVEYRVNLFLDNCRGVDLISATNFFLNGKEKPKKPLRSSMKKKETQE